MRNGFFDVQKVHLLILTLCGLLIQFFLNLLLTFSGASAGFTYPGGASAFARINVNISIDVICKKNDRFSFFLDIGRQSGSNV
jgi:hypothetical protein